MIQYPKNVHTTLPSVESWGASMNILQDPPKALWTRKIDKVGQTQEITNMIGEFSGDRICEYIKVYPRGINPMVSVSYSNYGTNGGQNRNFTNAGSWGKNKMSADGRRPMIGQAKLPYRLIDDGSFRPPVFRQEDLVPLSRLPRTNTEAWTKPGFISYAQNRECPPSKAMRQIEQNKLKTNVRPTAILNVQTPIVEPFQLRHVIDNPLHTSVESGLRTMDRSQTQHIDKINKGTKEILDGSITTNLNAPRLVEHNVQDINPANYTGIVRYSDVTTNIDKPSVQLLNNKISQFNKNPVKDDKFVHYTNISSGFDRPNAQPLTTVKDRNLIRPLPKYDYSVNKSSNHYKKTTQSQMNELNRNTPLTSIRTNSSLGNRGADVYGNGSRTKAIRKTLSINSSFDGKATVPYINPDRTTQFTSNQNKISIQNNVNLQRGERFQ